MLWKENSEKDMTKVYVDVYSSKAEPSSNARSMVLKKVISEFAINTTFHGVKYIAESTHPIRKVMWIIVVLGCICATGWQIVDRILYFRGHPVNVNVNINYNQSLQFPALTICNQNAFKASSAEAYGHYRLIEDMFSDSDSFLPRDLTKYGTGNLTLDDLYLPLSHRKEDFVVKCEWNKRGCSSRDFDVIATDHGICYTYKGDASGMRISSPGVDSGLRLTLNVENYEYMAGPHNSAGVKILLHDPEEFPQVHALGQAIPTGSHAFVGVTVKLINNLPKPHGTCEDLSLPHTDHYSSGECFRDCMTRMAEGACGCRDMHMPHVDGYPPVCTLEQYHGCFRNFMTKFHTTLKNQCVCPASCTFSMFDPTISYATISNQVVSKLLDSGETQSLKNKLRQGSEVTSRMDRGKFSETTGLVTRLVNYYNAIRSSVKEISERLSNCRNIFGDIFRNLERVYEKKEWLYRFQVYAVERNFLRAREAMEERTITNVALAFDEVARLTRRRIERLVYVPTIRSSERMILLDLILDTLQTRKEIANLAAENISELTLAYQNGRGIFNYSFEGLPISHTDHMAPRQLMKQSLVHNDYVKEHCPKMLTDLQLYENVTYMLMKIAMTAYETNSINETQFDYAIERFRFSCRNFMFSKSVCYTQGFERPVSVLTERLANFDTTWNSIQASTLEIEHNLRVLSDTLKTIETGDLPKFDLLMQKAVDYVKDNQSMLMDLARQFISETTVDVMRDLRNFFQVIQTRGQGVYDLWGLLHKPTVQLWTKVIDDVDMLDYYEFSNNTEFLQNLTEVIEDVTASYEKMKTEHDFRTNIANKDGDFFLAFEQLTKHLEDFVNSITIDGTFVKNNFLQVDVFFRQLSYEQIDQQIAYDFFALICDIGGSMGLFIGASMLTVVEIIDFLLIRIPVFGAKRRSKTWKPDQLDIQGITHEYI